MSSLSSNNNNTNKNNKEDGKNKMIQSILSSKISTKSKFRAKLAHIKLWKPANSPSNRDRLELYAFHKQAVSGNVTNSSNDDDSSTNSTNSSLADRAKRKAWMSKSGMTQEQAMMAYIMEADRQMQLYGTSKIITAPPNNSSSSRNDNHHPMAATATATATADDATTASSSSVFFTPRGLAAIPLLCAAASESRQSYLTRLSSSLSTNNNTNNNNNDNTNTKLWWHRQEPLCADPGTFLGIPETFTIWLGTQIESISTTTSLRVWHSYLWPIHNVALVLWMAIIIVSSLLTTAFIILQTMLYSTWWLSPPTSPRSMTKSSSSSSNPPSSTTGNRNGPIIKKSLSRRLEQILQEEVLPCHRACLSLAKSHQPISVRFLGLFCMPAVKLCQYATQSNHHATIQAVIFVLLAFLSSWYWTFCMVWIASMSLCFAFSIGWCFAIIQLAQDLTPY